MVSRRHSACLAARDKAQHRRFMEVGGVSAATRHIRTRSCAPRSPPRALRAVNRRSSGNRSNLIRAQFHAEQLHNGRGRIQSALCCCSLPSSSSSPSAILRKVAALASAKIPEWHLTATVRCKCNMMSCRQKAIAPPRPPRRLPSCLQTRQKFRRTARSPQWQQEISHTRLWWLLWVCIARTSKKGTTCCLTRCQATHIVRAFRP